MSLFGLFLNLIANRAILNSYSTLKIIRSRLARFTFSNMPFYAVANGRTTGIFTTWVDCEAQVKGFSGARYKKFDSVVTAQDFISSNSGNVSTSKTNLKRTYSTSTKYQSENNSSSSKISKRNNENGESSSNLFSDGFDVVLNKQLDDIEKRLKSFSKGLDKIVKVAKPSGRKAILLTPSEPKKSQRKTRNDEFEEDSEGFVQVYTDGACSGNGKTSAKAGIGVYWGEGHSLNVSEPVSGRATNNCGEIQASTRAIQQALSNGITKLTINTDSQFLINSVTKWIPGWKKNGWKLSSGGPVKNEKDFKDLDSVLNKLQVKWQYVEAHRGIHGNEMADQLAKAGAAVYIQMNK